ncbi:prepilin-type N-terminal cleavage/methylation domain-containing protein [candidate division KSB3 bacterium]|jgi:prepilin-type N-terminal cleavage/methylation domain-containing protein|uniref:Prepilin-type N-terminal cleavage/methylation domain-containing protein n=1 Tax=candidate division KSB3 bacterium TaxID=2044937 RepID=A0A9D5JTI6_9BACT|nr:prepilin-type N-terminal cleavage/methylation domain-containing protein [candidate division KSB3 bacterium]MBD3323942.1 prepilin-type N-terminal cleavage/methylation domain-containing protein [candidate division KSB3 bacterium]
MSFLRRQSKHNRMMHKQQGYTLIEAIIVVLILSSLVAVAMPNYLAWLHRYRLQSAAASMTNHFHAARLRSIFTGVNYQIQLKQAGAGNYYQVVEDPGGKDVVVPSIGRIVLHNQFGNVQIQEIPASGRITFTPRGTSTEATVLLENARKARVQIVVNSFGRVTYEYL